MTVLVCPMCFALGAVFGYGSQYLSCGCLCIFSMSPPFPCRPVASSHVCCLNGFSSHLLSCTWLLHVPTSSHSVIWFHLPCGQWLLNCVFTLVVVSPSTRFSLHPSVGLCTVKAGSIVCVSHLTAVNVHGTHFVCSSLFSWLPPLSLQRECTCMRLRLCCSLLSLLMHLFLTVL